MERVEEEGVKPRLVFWFLGILAVYYGALAAIGNVFGLPGRSQAVGLALGLAAVGIGITSARDASRDEPTFSLLKAKLLGSTAFVISSISTGMGDSGRGTTWVAVSIALLAVWPFLFKAPRSTT